MPCPVLDFLFYLFISVLVKFTHLLSFLLRPPLVFALSRAQIIYKDSLSFKGFVWSSFDFPPVFFKLFHLSKDKIPGTSCTVSVQFSKFVFSLCCDSNVERLLTYSPQKTEGCKLEKKIKNKFLFLFTLWMDESRNQANWPWFLAWLIAFVLLFLPPPPLFSFSFSRQRQYRSVFMSTIHWMYFI